MRKAIVFLFCIMVLALFLNSKTENVIIPEQSIRFRIIANSNNIEDQRLKLQINSIIFPKIQEIMNKSNSIEDTRTNIEKAIPDISNEVKTYTEDFNIFFGNNYFPNKDYKGVLYNEGEYESLVITLGKGTGDNWWCVMFPPLCLLEVKEADLDEVTYTTYVKKIINKFF